MEGHFTLDTVPKPASTVVLIDEDFNIFLTKRPKTMQFLGGFYVFPGGGMDEADCYVKDEYILGEINDDFLHKGYYIAGARELFEEVGILLGERSDGRSLQLTERERETLRKQLLLGELTFGQMLEREQLLFRLDCLQYFGELITPEEFPIRYDTKFFLAKLPEGQEPKPSEREIDEAFWVSAEEGLRLNETKEILLAPPTLVVLESIIKFKNGDQLTIESDRVEYLTKNFSM